MHQQQAEQSTVTGTLVLPLFLSIIDICFCFQIDHTNAAHTDGPRFHNAVEVIHIPIQFQRFQGLLDLPQVAGASIRQLPSTTRTVGMFSTVVDFSHGSCLSSTIDHRSRFHRIQCAHFKQ